MIEYKNSWGTIYKINVHKRLTPKFKKELNKLTEEYDSKSEANKKLLQTFDKLDIWINWYIYESTEKKIREQYEELRLKMLCVNKTLHGRRTYRCTWIQYDEKTAKKHLEKSERKMRSFARQHGISYE